MFTAFPRVSKEDKTTAIVVGILVQVQHRPGTLIQSLD